ncbi:zinc finger protein 217 isoform 2-T2 [Anomaloglossus baeobatrachus]|uniref:zinc finger protein 217 isoform X2 n=1 Tax=Anomaloglossus baeobatrachus TaxID=238106 RepID=UPI003F4F8638
MPIQSQAGFVNSPEVISNMDYSKMESARSSRAKKRQQAISQKTLQESFLIPAEGDRTFDCMFCHDTYKTHEELGKHVLTRHKATLLEPTVLCVEAEYLGPNDEHKNIAMGSAKQDKKDDKEVFNCEVCGKTFIDSANLVAHMKKHKEFFLFSCNICGRRFKEPWFLKNHKRTHSSRTGGKNKHVVPETPTTINEIVQEPVVKSITSSYKTCMMCGFHFRDQESLSEHIKAHSKILKVQSDAESATRKEQENVPQEEFMGFLNLKPKAKEPETSNKSIKELDPFNTYQAWQLATKGKVALGFAHVKEPSVEAKMETDSEKDEISDIQNTGNSSQSVDLEDMDTDKSEECAKDGPSQDLAKTGPSQDLDESETPKRDEKAKVKSKQDKKPICSNCGKVFRTYQQVVVHSRVHRKDRSDSETSSTSHIEELLPTSAPDTPASVEDKESVKMEDMSEGERKERLQNKKAKRKTKLPPASNQCSYCKKSFRSNYYLNIHFRIHTGEKPYTCEVCRYKVAQKTSMRYHFDKYHGDLPEDSDLLMKSLIIPLQLDKTPPDLPEANIQTSRIPKKRTSKTKKDTLSTKPPRRMSALRNKLVNTNQLFKIEQIDTIKKEPEEERPGTPISTEEISLQCQETLEMEICSKKEETSEESPVFTPHIVVDLEAVPLDLSVKSREDIPATLNYSALLLVHNCLNCTYRTLYPELLILHQRLVHKQNYDLHKNSNRTKNPGLVLKMRRTGCPLALQGVDVTPMLLDGAKPKTSASAMAKAINQEKPKRAPAQTNKVTKSETDCKSVEQENKFQSGQQVGSFRYMQPDLQNISHLLERMPQPDQKLSPWIPNSQTISGNLNGSEHPSHIMSSLFGDNPFTRSQGELNPFTQRIANGMLIPASSSNFINTDILRGLHPTQVNLTNLDRPSIKLGPSVLTNNVPYPYEMDLHWNLKSYEQPPAGVPLAVSNPPVNQGSDASVEGKPNVYLRIAKRGYGPNEKIP